MAIESHPPENRYKLSAKKVSLLGQKQIFRVLDAARRYQHDIIALRDEQPVAVAPGVTRERVTPLLMHVMTNGKRLPPRPSLAESRALFVTEFAKLPDAYKQLQEPERYPVALSPQLAHFQAQAVAQLQARYGFRTTSQ